jgi:hypothetical protein
VKLPDGLFVCPNCGGIRGTEVTPTSDGVELGATSLCLCDGIVCRYCGEGRVRRPISDWYDPEKSGWWHTPYFGGMRQCAECGGPVVLDYR